jgi:hypothetical protein
MLARAQRTGGANKFGMTKSCVVNMAEIQLPVGTIHFVATNFNPLWNDDDNNN